MRSVVLVWLMWTCTDGQPDEANRLLNRLRNIKAETFATSQYYVYHIEADEIKPGYMIYTDKHAIKTTDGVTTDIIAGSVNAGGDSGGIGKQARFFYPQGFTQITNGKTIVLASVNKGCIREIDRATGKTSIFAGDCQKTGYQDGLADKSKFFYPKAFLIDGKNSNNLLVVDYWNSAIRIVALNTSEVGTLIRDENAFNPLKNVIQDSVSGDFYAIAEEPSQRVFKIGYSDNIVTVIAGTGQNGYEDGPFHLSRFRNPAKLWQVSPDILLMADNFNHKIRILDLDLNTTSTLSFCKKCGQVQQPFTVFLWYEVLYVGQYRGILRFDALKGYFLTTSQLTTKATRGTDSLSTTVQTVSQSTRRVSTSTPPADTTATPADTTATTTTTSTDNPSSAPESARINLHKRVEFQASYAVKCSLLSDPITTLTLHEKVQQHFKMIERLCRDDCAVPTNATFTQTCLNDRLRISWQTNVTYPGDITDIPADLKLRLTQSLINTSRMPILKIVITSKNPPIVYPIRSASGAYAELILTNFCLNNQNFDPLTQTCG